MPKRSRALAITLLKAAIIRHMNDLTDRMAAKFCVRLCQKCATVQGDWRELLACVCDASLTQSSGLIEFGELCDAYELSPFVLNNIT
jgi:hypothetical protein